MTIQTCCQANTASNSGNTQKKEIVPKTCIGDKISWRFCRRIDKHIFISYSDNFKFLSLVGGEFPPPPETEYPGYSVFGGGGNSPPTKDKKTFSRKKNNNSFLSLVGGEIPPPPETEYHRYSVSGGGGISPPTKDRNLRLSHHATHAKCRRSRLTHV